MPNAGKEVIKAAKAGDADRVRELIESDVTLIDARDLDGSRPLHCAVWKGHRHVVEYLLSVGADVKAHNDNEHWGTTPLHAAAHANQAEIAQLLIAYGADVNATDRNGQTPLHHTTYHKAKAAVRVLLASGAK